MYTITIRAAVLPRNSAQNLGLLILDDSTLPASSSFARYIPMIMNMLMNVPMKAATATSSYMIGITAFSGAVIYFINGHVDLEVAAMVAVGCFIGAVVGSRVSKYIDGASLKRYFSILLLIIAIVMIIRIGGML